MPRTMQFEDDGSTTAVRAGCLERIPLDEDGFVPPHKQPGPTGEPSVSRRMAAEPPNIRPDLHKLITCHDDVLTKVEAGAVLPEYVRLHLKEERTLLVDILESLGEDDATA
jgi:hypothetical protein